MSQVQAAARVLASYRERILFAYLFGSRARGDATTNSDFDFAVYCTPGTPEGYFGIRLAVHADLCRALGRNDVDLLVLNTTTNLILLDEVVRHGTVLYDRDPEARMDFEVKALHRAMDFKAQRLAIMGV